MLCSATTALSTLCQGRPYLHMYIYNYIYFQGVRSRSRDKSTWLSRTSNTKFLRLEGSKMVHAKYNNAILYIDKVGQDYLFFHAYRLGHSQGPYYSISGFALTVGQ